MTECRLPTRIKNVDGFAWIVYVKVLATLQRVVKIVYYALNPFIWVKLEMYSNQNVACMRKIFKNKNLLVIPLFDWSCAWLENFKLLENWLFQFIVDKKKLKEYKNATLSLRQFNYNSFQIECEEKRRAHYKNIGSSRKINFTLIFFPAIYCCHHTNYMHVSAWRAGVGKDFQWINCLSSTAAAMHKCILMASVLAYHGKSSRGSSWRGCSFEHGSRKGMKSDLPFTRFDDDPADDKASDIRKSHSFHLLPTFGIVNERIRLTFLSLLNVRQLSFYSQG